MTSIIASVILGIRRRRSERELLELDDRLLRDMGIDRHSIGRPSAQRVHRR